MFSEGKEDTKRKNTRDLTRRKESELRVNPESFPIFDFSRKTERKKEKNTECSRRVYAHASVLLGELLVSARSIRVSMRRDDGDGDLMYHNQRGDNINDNSIRKPAAHVA